MKDIMFWRVFIHYLKKISQISGLVSVLQSNEIKIIKSKIVFVNYFPEVSWGIFQTKLNFFFQEGGYGFSFESSRVYLDSFVK